MPAVPINTVLRSDIESYIRLLTNWKSINIITVIVITNYKATWKGSTIYAETRN